MNCSRKSLNTNKVNVISCGTVSLVVLREVDRVCVRGSMAMSVGAGLNVRDVMDKLRSLKIQLQERDRSVEDLTQQLNRQDRYVYGVVEDWRKLRRASGLSETLSSEEEAHVFSTFHQRLEAMQSEIGFFQARVDDMEKERQHLLDNLRMQMVSTNEAGLKFYGLSADQMALVVRYAESLRDGTNVMPLNDASRKLQQQLQGNRACVVVSCRVVSREHVHVFRGCNYIAFELVHVLCRHRCICIYLWQRRTNMCTNCKYAARV